ncbi:MAG: tetratricopeptide repeat protein, partial [Planctomycetota bacterium]
LAGFLALRESGIRSAALEYNLGNTHFRLGDLGRAILHYRRAERRAGGEARVQANLRYARGRVEPQIPASGETRLTRQLLFWHYRTTLTVRAWIMLILAAIAWPLLFLWLQRRRNGLLIAGSIGVIASFALGASVLWQMHDQAARPAAVTVAAEEYLRLGRGANADRALKQPLGPGVELRILQQRGDWVEVRLPNDQTGWLPQGAVERV